MAGKVNSKFMALCTLAIGIVYSIGYEITVPGNATVTSSAQVSPSTSHGSNNSGHAISSTTKSTSSKSSSSASTNTKVKYLDGIYSGSAANRIGSVSVSVSVKSGEINNVQITACDTHYPQSYIDPVLPKYVVTHQTANIPVVSGATLSTEDFQYAVVQALSKAQNPHYKA